MVPILYAQTLQNKHFLRVTACILGYTLWMFMSNDYIIQKTYTIPVAFYNVSQDTTIDGPSTVQVTVRGKRFALRRIIQEHLVLHIDAGKLEKKENRINPYNGSLFLPETSAVVCYDPLYLTIFVHEGNSTQSS